MFTILKVVITVSLVAIGIDATAKDFEHQKELDRLSRTSGVGVSKVELMERLPGPGMQQMVQSLFAQFTNRSDALSVDEKAGYHVDSEEDNYSVRDKEGTWKIKVWADGSRFMFRNEQYTNNPEYKRIPVDQRFSNETLESMGREFIEKELSELITISDNDEIVPIRTVFEVDVQTTSFSAPPEREIASAVMSFGRRVNGVEVVGSGSKIEVFIANDGTVIGYTVDWPDYKFTGEMQTTIAANEILERLSTYGTLHKGTANIELRRFECGYYDAGVRYRDPYAPIQAGCLLNTVGSIDSRTESGELASDTVSFVNNIPAGADVEWDDNWPETWVVGENADFCTETALSACLSGNEEVIPVPKP